MENICKGDFVSVNNNFVETALFNPEVSLKGTCVYDVIKVKNRDIIHKDLHFKRLADTAKGCNLTLWISFDDLYLRCKSLIEKCNIEEGCLKIVFSFNNNSFQDCKDSLFIHFLNYKQPSPGEYKNGINTLTFKAVRHNPKFKIYNKDLRIAEDNFIADNNINEAILVDNDNNITEGSRSNIFFIKSGELFTPPSDSVLPGITAKIIREICKKSGIIVNETIIPVNSISDYQAAFISDTPRGICPVAKINDVCFNAHNLTLKLIKYMFDN